MWNHSVNAHENSFLLRLATISPRNRGCPGMHFVQCFRAVWRALPLSVRRALLTYWKSQPTRLQIRFRDPALLKHGLTGCCADDGWTLTFHSCADSLPPKKVCADIAHEIGHAYRRAAGLVAWQIGVGAYEQEEVAVHQLCAEWGFPQKGSTKPPASVRDFEAKFGAPDDR
jgi:hypothetical protein